jgi:hypothetical protein
MVSAHVGRSRRRKEAPMAAKKLPIEEQALKLLRDVRGA